jgi:DNA invertase Pin-like site-specific DNA recombinase
MMATKQHRAALGLVIALIYTRVSSDEQSRDGVSLDVQLTDCRRYAAGHGWVLGTEYQDVLSGTRDDRPQYQALLAEARRLRAEGQAVVVVVWRLDRFGRRVLERVRCREELKALGVPLHSVQEGGEVSDLVANILASVAEEETRQIGERVSAAKQHVMATGWHPGGRVAWGYALREATPAERARGAPLRVLVEDAETAPYVREAFRRVARGQSVRQVATWAAGLPEAARGGRALPFASVQRALTCPLYVGRHLHGTADVLARPRGQWPALVDEATWLAVHTYIASHARLPHQASGQYLLTGLLRCPVCGTRMFAQRRRDAHARYRCQGRTRGANAPVLGCDAMALVAPVDTATRAQVAARVAVATARTPGLPRELARAWQALQAPQMDATAQVARSRTQLERQVAQSTQRLTRAATLLVDGGIDRAGYDLLCASARADLDAAQAALAIQQGADGPPSAPLPPWETVLTAVGGWEAALAGADVLAQREVLAVLVAAVVPRRIGYGQYAVDLTWTPLGAALGRLAALGQVA